MNPTIETPTVEAKPVKKPAKAAKAEQVPTPAENPARAELHAKVKALLAKAKDAKPDAALVFLREAMETVRSAVPDVKLSENKEQRGAQLKALRMLRAEMGCQQLARLIGDAIAALPGAEQSRRYRASVLKNGSLSAVESITTKVKNSTTHRGFSIR